MEEDPKYKNANNKVKAKQTLYTSLLQTMLEIPGKLQTNKILTEAHIRIKEYMEFIEQQKKRRQWSIERNLDNNHKIQADNILLNKPGI